MKKAWWGMSILLAVFLSGSSLYAQSGAINGQIEGIVTDPSGAVVPNARVTATNVDTGIQRETTTDASGLYRFPLLALGTYKVTVEAQGFNKYEHSGITVTSGSIAAINVELKVGTVAEAVQVTAEAPVADPARVDVGALVDNRRVQNLPLVSRNVYNFILLQPNVSANPNTEFGVPRRINANGFTDRIDYQLDGGNNTQSDRKGIRLMPISQTFVKEIVVATNGFAPEFGNTVGTVFNAVTNSGTNDWHGSGAYLFRRPSFNALNSTQASNATRQPIAVDNGFGTIGGPIRRDKLHFFASYEKVNRGIPSPIAITAANAAALGIPDSELGFTDFAQFVHFLLGRVDWQISPKHRLMGRYMYFRNNSPNNPQNSPAGSLQVRSTSSTQFVDRAHGAAGQLVSIFSPTLINEFRFQYGYRKQKEVPGDQTPSGPNIFIPGIISFGGPNDLNFVFKEQAPDVVNNLSWVKGAHSLKLGVGARFILDDQTTFVFSRYTFPSIAAYLAAKSGASPKGYSSYTQVLGNPSLSYNSTFWGFYAQDTWTVTPRLNLVYGLRYDLYVVPEANPTSTLDISKNFNVDKNNFAPRFGVAYSLDKNRKTVLRLSSGIFYDFPQTDIYRRAIFFNGNPSFFSANILPADPLAPSFPNTFTTPPSVSAPIQDVVGVARDFANLRSFNVNAQVTRELRSDTAFTLAYLYTKGTHIPVTRNINPVRVLRQLADGRPIFSTAAADRRFPQFNNVTLHESAGNSIYSGFNASLNKRFSHGFQVQASYTWSHAIDDSPEENVLDSGNLTLEDPLSRARDRGNSFTDRRHIVTISGVLSPSVKLSSSGLNYLLNHNQISFLVNGGSGDIFNIVCGCNLTNNPQAQGVTRPLYIGRNTVRGQAIAQLDLRYSRFVPITERYRVEILGEFTNLFNHTNVTGMNTTATVNTNLNDPSAGVITRPPTFLTTSTANRDQRLFQLGFRFIF